MKKILVISLALGMILSFAPAAYGASVSLGALVGGFYYEENYSDFDADGFSLSAEFAVGEKCNIGVDYWSGDYEAYANNDYGYLEVDFGYRVLDGDFTLDVFAGYVMSDFYGDFEGKNLVLGVDAVYGFSDSFALNATVKFSAWGDDNWGQGDFTTAGCALGVTYSFNENLGVSLGYTYTKHTADGFNDFGIRGFTLGAVYSF